MNENITKHIWTLLFWTIVILSFFLFLNSTDKRIAIDSCIAKTGRTLDCQCTYRACSPQTHITRALMNVDKLKVGGDNTEYIYE